MQKIPLLRMNRLSILIALVIFTSCSGSGVKKEDAKVETIKNEHAKKQQKTAENTDFKAEGLELQSNETFENGIVISWIERGEGAKVQKGDMLLIDYKVNLENGKVIDGNHLWKKESFPFMVGFQMQTKGWDFALEKMRIGDFARIKIPAALARGVKGIKKEGEKDWFVPPNSDNYLTIRILEKEKPTREVDGNKVWLFEENKANKLLFNEKNEITFHCMISSESNPFYYNSYRNNSPYTLRMTDKGIIPGLKKALINAKKADRLFVLVPASEAYGSKGSEGFVKPNESLLYNVLVMDVAEK